MNKEYIPIEDWDKKLTAEIKSVEPEMYRTVLYIVRQWYTDKKEALTAPAFTDLQGKVLWKYITRSISEIDLACMGKLSYQYRRSIMKDRDILDTIRELLTKLRALAGEGK